MKSKNMALNKLILEKLETEHFSNCNFSPQPQTKVKKL